MPKYRHTIVVNVAFTPIIVTLLLILELLAQLIKRSKSQPDQSEYEFAT